MSLPAEFVQHVEILFAPLARPAAAKYLPRISALSSRLEEHLERVSLSAAAQPSVNLVPADTAMFATAAVEIWQRAVHSYLISASLTEASPLWASVSGYYSSHYSVRAMAHLLGCFHLYSKKKIARLKTGVQRHVCIFDKKSGDDREHKAYWKLVKESGPFKGDPLFTFNESNTEPSDVAHRDRANYADHIGSFPNFKPLNESNLKARLKQISQIKFDVPPIPKRSKYPDINAVQVVAYHRLVKFRTALDEVLATRNPFWNRHRNPTWAGVINFQLAEQGGISAFAN